MSEENPLVSIIIPTYNRAHLIGETLDSVLAQTYQNWECIVVDDGSTDNTDELILNYIAKDNRFKYCHRPADKPKGANACRNYGLELAKGEYINWFDSDDLMRPNFMIRKLEVLKKHQVDFVVSESLNFDNKGTYELKKYKGNLKYELTGKNYILRKVYWITQDFLIHRGKLGNYNFNETLHSGQETSFFIVLLNIRNLKGKAINETLSFRRLHDTSIQQTLKKSRSDAYRGKLKSLLSTYIQIYKTIDNETKHYMQREIMTVFYQLKLKNVGANEFRVFMGNLFYNKNPLKASAFFISMLLNSYFNIGYKLFEFSRS